jgi:hypothetical protein
MQFVTVYTSVIDRQQPALTNVIQALQLVLAKHAHYLDMCAAESQANCNGCHNDAENDRSSCISNSDSCSTIDNDDIQYHVVLLVLRVVVLIHFVSTIASNYQHALGFVSTCNAPHHHHDHDHDHYHYHQWLAFWTHSDVQHVLELTEQASSCIDEILQHHDKHINVLVAQVFHGATTDNDEQHQHGQQSLFPMSLVYSVSHHTTIAKRSTPSWVLSDFDITMTENDTSHIIPESVISTLASNNKHAEAATHRKRWDLAVARYYDRYAREVKAPISRTYHLISNANGSSSATGQPQIEHLFSTLDQTIDTFEPKMVQPILHEQLLNGATKEHIGRACQQVIVRPGAAAALRAIQQYNDKRITDTGACTPCATTTTTTTTNSNTTDAIIQLGIISMNWSEEVICEPLRSTGLCVSAASDLQAPIDSKYRASDVFVVCNRLDYEQSDVPTTSGLLHMRVITSRDKVNVATALLHSAYSCAPLPATHHNASPAAKPASLPLPTPLFSSTVYIGDSTTDLRLLLYCQTGIVIDAAATQAELARLQSASNSSSSSTTTTTNNNSSTATACCTRSSLSLSSTVGMLCTSMQIRVVPLLTAAIDDLIESQHGHRTGSDCDAHDRGSSDQWHRKTKRRGTLYLPLFHLPLATESLATNEIANLAWHEIAGFTLPTPPSPTS